MSTGLTTTAEFVHIDEVEIHSAESDYVHGANIDRPAPGSGADSYTLLLVGWVLSKGIPVEHVEVLHEEQQVAVGSLDRERPDLAAGFPELEGAGFSGYRLKLNTLRLSADFELVLRAKLEDGTRLPLGRLRGHRRRLPAASAEAIQPLMVNTIGRSGSTLLVTLLSSHPDVIAFSPFLKDARVSTYWTNVLQDLSDQAAYLAPFDPSNLDTPRWWLDGGRDLGDEKLERWLGGEAIDSLCALCQGQIESFYSHLGEPERPGYFVEKYLPHQVVPDLLAELYPGAREVVLVRDFRDLLCSVISFNRKRGWDAFGRSEGGDDAEYVRTTLRQSGELLVKRLRKGADGPQLVRYEDLVLNPEPTLVELFGKLGMDADPEVVRETIRLTQESTAEMEHHRTTSDPAASIGRWRADLPEDIAAVCNEELGPLLHEFGYEDS
jgi:hypothetical protein